VYLDELLAQSPKSTYKCEYIVQLLAERGPSLALNEAIANLRAACQDSLWWDGYFDQCVRFANMIAARTVSPG